MDVKMERSCFTCGQVRLREPQIPSDLWPGGPISQAIWARGTPYRRGPHIALRGGDGLLRVTCPPDTLLRGASYFETVPLVWGGSLRLAPNIHTSGRFDDVYTGGTNFEVCV